MSIMNLICLSISYASLEGHSIARPSPHDRRKVSADTNSKFDFTTINNDYTQETGHIKKCFLKLEDFTGSTGVSKLKKTLSLFESAGKY